MSYGAEILTSKGYQSVGNISSARVIKIVQCRTVSGSESVPEFDSDKGDFLPFMNSYSYGLPNVYWDNSTKILSWDNPTSINNGAFSNNFDVYLVHTK